MTAETLIKLWEQEEKLSRELITIRGLIAREQEIYLQSLFLKIQETISQANLEKSEQ